MTTVLFQRDRLLGFFNDFLEAGIAAQRVPPWEQFECAIAERAWEADDALQLFEGGLCRRPRQRSSPDSSPADFLHYIFLRISEVDRMLAFTQRVLFPPEIGVDQPKQAPYSAIIRLGFDDFRVLRACSDKS